MVAYACISETAKVELKESEKNNYDKTYIIFHIIDYQDTGIDIYRAYPMYTSKEMIPNIYKFFSYRIKEINVDDPEVYEEIQKRERREKELDKVFSIFNF